MIQDITRPANVIVDSTAENEMEQPLIIEDCPNSQGVIIKDYAGDTIYINYRMIPEVMKAMKSFIPKSKK